MAALPSELLDDLDDLGSDDEQAEDVDGSSGPGASSSLLGSAASSSAAGGIGSSGGAAAASARAEAAGDSDDDEDEESDGDADGDDDGDESSAAAGGAGAGAGAQGKSSGTKGPAVNLELAPDAELDAQLASMAGSSARTGYRTVAKLRETKRFQEHLARVKAALAAGISSTATAGRLEDWPEYKLVVSSNAMVAAVDDEVVALHRYVADAYRRRFPELETVLPVPSEYLRAVRAIGNESDLTLVDLAALGLPSATVMVITVTGSASAGKPLPDDVLADVFGACDEVSAVEADKASILAFIESRMATVAPNVSALVGTRIAAMLVGVAGGVAALSRVPGDTVMLLGQKRRGATGFGRHAGTPHVGVLAECVLVSGAPADLRRRAAKLIGAKVAIAARVDAYGESAAGDVGRRCRKECAGKITKWQEPPPGRTKRPLPAPDDKPGKRRGGRRARAYKERMGMTAARKEANRMVFGSSTGAEYGDGAMGLDAGMAGSSGTGKLRIERKEQKGLTVKKRRLEGKYAGSSGATGGFASSLAFTPSQGIELANPAAAAMRARMMGILNGGGAGSGAASGGAGSAGGSSGAATDYFSGGAFSSIVRK